MMETWCRIPTKASRKLADMDLLPVVGHFNGFAHLVQDFRKGSVQELNLLGMSFNSLVCLICCTNSDSVVIQ